MSNPNGIFCVYDPVAPHIRDPNDVSRLLPATQCYKKEPRKTRKLENLDELKQRSKLKLTSHTLFEKIGIIMIVPKMDMLCCIKRNSRRVQKPQLLAKNQQIECAIMEMR